MADITIHVETAGEIQFLAMARLVEELTTGAGAELRPARAKPGDLARQLTNSGLSLTELVVTGALSAATLKAVSAVLVAWVQARSKRKLTLKSGKDQLVVDGTITQAQQDLIEKWLSERG